MDNVTVCILTFNRMDCLKEQLDHLQSLQLYNNIEIIVVDNCSNDGTERMMVEEFPQIIYKRTTDNIGASARNIGLKLAANDIIITLDDDVLGLSLHDITEILHKFSEVPKLAALNFKVINHHNGQICNWVHHCRHEEFSDREFCTYEITEGAVAFRKNILSEIGFYSDVFFISHEGLDMALKMLDLGYVVMYTNKVSVYHKHSLLGRKIWFNYYYDVRNQFFLTARNLPLFFAVKYLFKGLSSTLVFSVRDGYFKYWLKAIIDGILGFKKASAERHVIKPETINIINSIDIKQPGLFYLIKSRLFRKDARL
jgi:GT2 family glycosyltransferase